MKNNSDNIVIEEEPLPPIPMNDNRGKLILLAILGGAGVIALFAFMVWVFAQMPK
jgi:hypothetical protein